MKDSIEQRLKGYMAQGLSQYEAYQKAVRDEEDEDPSLLDRARAGIRGLPGYDTARDVAMGVTEGATQLAGYVTDRAKDPVGTLRGIGEAYGQFEAGVGDVGMTAAAGIAETAGMDAEPIREARDEYVDENYGAPQTGAQTAARMAGTVAPYMALPGMAYGRAGLRGAAAADIGLDYLTAAGDEEYSLAGMAEGIDPEAEGFQGGVRRTAESLTSPLGGLEETAESPVKRGLAEAVPFTALAYGPDAAVRGYGRLRGMGESGAAPNVSRGRPEPRLRATHNTTLEGVQFADEMGGVPNPSLAVHRADQPFDSMGEVSLVGNRDLVNPAAPGTEVYDADIYSARTPRRQFETTPESEEIIRELAEESRRIEGDGNVPGMDELANGEDAAGVADRLSRSPTGQAAYLRAQGADVGPTMGEPRYRSPAFDTPEVQEWARSADTLNPDYGSEAHREWSEAVKAGIRNKYTTEVDRELADDMLERLTTDDGLIAYNQTTWIPDDFRKFEAGEEIDASATRQNVSEALEQHGGEQAARQWWESRIRGAYGEPYFETSSGRKRPFTLEGLSEEMGRQSNPRARERRMVYGPGEARASSARRMESVDEFDDYRADLVSREEIAEVKKAQEDARGAVAERLVQSHPDESMWDTLDDMHRAAGRYGRGDRTDDAARQALEATGFRAPSDEAVSSFREYADSIVDAPTQYLEVKMRRPVNLDEFSGAVLPDDAPPNVIDGLKARGLEVETYPRNDTQARTEAFERMKGGREGLEESGMLFVRGTGPLTGGAIGATQGDTPEERGRNALLGAAIGAGGEAAPAAARALGRATDVGDEARTGIRGYSDLAGQERRISRETRELRTDDDIFGEAQRRVTLGQDRRMRQRPFEGPDRRTLPGARVGGELEEMRRVMGSGPQTFYRETSLESAMDFLPGTHVGRVYEDIGVYVSDTPNLALGQGENRGVMLEFDRGTLSGNRNQEKPGLSFTRERGADEYILERNAQGDYQNHLRAVTIDPDAPKSKLAEHRALPMLDRLVSEEGWTKTNLPDGRVRYERAGTAETANPRGGFGGELNEIRGMTDPRAGFGTPDIARSLAGGTTGSAVGAASAEEGESPIARGIVGFGAGAAAGAAAGPATRRMVEGRADDALPSTGLREADAPPLITPSQRALEAADEVNIRNFNLDIEGEERVRRHIGRIMETGRESDLGQRTVTWDETRRVANELGLDPGELDKTAASRMTGAELLAVRDIVAQNIDDMTRIEKRLRTGVSETGMPLTIGDREQAQRLVNSLTSQNEKMLRKFVKSRSEMGRNLNSLKILANRSLDPVAWTAKAEKVKGVPLSEFEGRELRRLLAKGERAELVKYVGSLYDAPLPEKLVTLWKAGLLSNPATHQGNIVGNFTMATLEGMKDAPAALFDRVAASVSDVQAKDGVSLDAVKAGWDAVDPEATRNVARILVEPTAGAAIGGATGSAVSDEDSPLPWVAGAAGGLAGFGHALSRVPGQLDDAAMLAKYDIHRQVDYDEWGKLSPFLNAYAGPNSRIFSSLTEGDKVFKNFAMGRSLTEQARVIARNEGLEGPEFAQRVNELIETDAELHMRAIADAEVSTFLNKGGHTTFRGIDLAEAGEGLRRSLGSAGHVVIPFTRTPANIMDRVLEYSPVGFLADLPKAAEWMQKIRQGEKAGGLNGQDLAELMQLQKEMVEQAGRATVGTTAMLIGYTLADQGILTGNYPSSDATERNIQDITREQPHSIKVGDEWLGLDRLSPLGNLMTIGAEVHSMAQDSEVGLAGGVKALPAVMGKTVVDQSFLRGVQGALDAISNPERSFARWARSTVASAVPSGIYGVTRAVDPTIRDPQSVPSAIQGRLPGLSTGVTPTIDAFGEERQRSTSAVGRLGTVASPFMWRESREDDPVRSEVARVGASISRYSPRGVDRGTPEYEALQREYGQASEEAVREVIESSAYRNPNREVSDLRRLPENEGVSDEELEDMARKEMIEDAVRNARADLTRQRSRRR